MNETQCTELQTPCEGDCIIVVLLISKVETVE